MLEKVASQLAALKQQHTAGILTTAEYVGMSATLLDPTTYVQSSVAATEPATEPATDPSATDPSATEPAMEPPAESNTEPTTVPVPNASTTTVPNASTTAKRKETEPDLAEDSPLVKRPRLIWLIS